MDLSFCSVSAAGMNREQVIDAGKSLLLDQPSVRPFTTCFPYLFLDTDLRLLHDVAFGSGPPMGTVDEDAPVPPTSASAGTGKASSDWSDLPTHGKGAYGKFSSFGRKRA